MTIPATPGGAGSTPEVEAYLEATAGQRLQRYLDFLRIPSISGIPGHAPDCRRAAGKLADDLRAAGLEHVEVSETGGHPIVYADWLHASGAPTVLLYGHYDVQPVDPVEEWEAAPFEPIVRTGASSPAAPRTTSRTSRSPLPRPRRSWRCAGRSP